MDARSYARGFLTVDTNAPRRVARGMASFVWSPCVWRGGMRLRENFLRADWAVLDFDSGEMTLAEAANTWCDMAHVIGTTKSHQVVKGDAPACDRFRVALLLERPVTQLADYEHIMRTLIGKYPADPAAKDGARFFYPCRQIVAHDADGDTLEWQPAPPVTLDATARAKAMDAYRFERWQRLPRWLEAFLADGTLVGKGRNHTAYCAARTLTELGAAPELIRARIMAAPIERGGLVAGEIERAIEHGMTAGAPHGRAPGEVDADRGGQKQTPPSREGGRG